MRRISIFDKTKFAELLLIAKGDRSINQYAQQSRITAAHISRLSRSLLDSPPTPQTIKKLADHAYNNITYEDMMAAAGYIPSEDVINEKDNLRLETNDNDFLNISPDIRNFILDEKNHDLIKFIKDMKQQGHSNEIIMEWLLSLSKTLKVMKEKHYPDQEEDIIITWTDDDMLPPHVREEAKKEYPEHKKKKLKEELERNLKDPTLKPPWE